MSSWTEEELEKFQKQDFRQKEALKKSGRLGCFSCGYIFSYHLVEEFFEEKNTAICPVCGADAVLPLAGFPESMHAKLLEEMHLKHFASDEAKARLMGDNHFFLYQKAYRTPSKAFKEIEEKLRNSKRNYCKNVYEEYENAESLSFPVFSGEITIYPLDRKFVQYLLPTFTHSDNFPKESKKILEEMSMTNLRACFIIDLPGKLSEREAEHLVKLIGMAFGGYFSNVTNLPSDGYLTITDHIFINSYQNQEMDIIDNLERLLKKYG